MSTSMLCVCIKYSLRDLISPHTVFESAIQVKEVF